MGSFGPQLPPHLAKRKRTPEDDGAPTSPPSKARKGANNDEIDLGDESSDDDGGYGPVAPRVPSQGASAVEPSIGPSMPPSLTHNADEIDLDDDDVGPLQPPPADANSISPPSHKRSVGPTMPPPASTNAAKIPLSASGPAPLPAAPKRTYGPSLPPVSSSAQATHPNPSPDSDSDSDSDDYGPAPPSAATSSRPVYASRMPQEAAPEPTRRDEWMLAPPSASDRREQDPTKLKNRSFRSGPSAATSANAQKAGVASIWTETAQEKLARLQNSVLGRGSDEAAQGSANNGGRKVESSREAEQRRKIEEYTAQTRGKSLYEERQEAKKSGKMRPQDEDDDPSKRPFDREKDMAIGGNLGAAKKRELLNKSSNFGDRFQKGSYL